MSRNTLPIAIVCIALSACGSGGGDSDADAACPEFDPWRTGDDGADVSVPPPAGEARAGRISSPGDVPPGVKNKAEVGDFMLRNGRVVFVIEDGGPSDGYGPFGGEIVHADLVGPDGEPLGNNLFGESYHGLAARLLDPQSVTVLSDGSDGGEAVVRVVGEVVNMPLLDVGFSVIFDVNDGATYSADYVLGPDDEYLEVRFNVRNPLARLTYVNLFMFGTVQGDGLMNFTDDGGFDESTRGGRHALYGHVGEDISYGWMNPDGGTLQQVITESGMFIGEKGDMLGIEACTTEVVGMIRLVVAGGGAESLLAARRRIEGVDEPASSTFSVSVVGGGDAAGARVHVTDAAGGYVTSIIAGESGIFTAGLAAGDYLATAVLDGHPPLRDEPFSVPAGGADVDLAIPQAGTVDYTVVDDAGTPSPAKLIVYQDPTPSQLPAMFGEKEYPRHASLVLFQTAGSGSFFLPPGDYAVTTSRGFEYEIDEQDITVSAGAATALDVTLDHVVDSTGIMCGDFHVHSVHSADSSDPRRMKLEAAVAEGLEILASTDHEWTADYAPDVEAAGLQGLIHGLSGEELTTFAYGHFNVFPQTVRPDQPNGGAIDWYYREAPEVFAEVRTDPYDPVLQINHPRSESFQGYFTALGFDPADGSVGHPERWSPDFDAMECFNSKDFNAEIDAVLDWFALLSMGMSVAVTGNSDSHDLVGDELGYCRTCMIFGHDDPSALTHEAVRDAIKGMRAVVSGGILVTAEGPAGEGPGDVADAPGGSADVHVLVQAPLWIDVDVLRVFVDGIETETITLDDTTADPANPVVRYDDTLTVSTADGADGWVVVEAEGDVEMDPVVLGRLPFGVTNPIYLDADGDGEILPRLSIP